MSILVNEEKVPEELIEEEMKRLVAMPGFQSIPDEAERAAKAHKAAEMACIDSASITRPPCDPCHRTSPPRLPGSRTPAISSADKVRIVSIVWRPMV